MISLPPFRFVLPHVAANYAKRWADQHVWDRLMETRFGQRLRSQSRPTRYAIEHCMYLLSAVMQHNIGSSTPLRTFVGGFADDIAPEIAKRMLNGEHQSKPTPPATPTTQSKHHLTVIEMEPVQAVKSDTPSTANRLASIIAPW